MMESSHSSRFLGVLDVLAVMKPALERFSQLLALCFSLLGKETDQATGPMIMKFALVVQPLSV
jgi:hypothetical protein